MIAHSAQWLAHSLREEEEEEEEEELPRARLLFGHLSTVGHSSTV